MEIPKEAWLLSRRPPNVWQRCCYSWLVPLALSSALLSFSCDLQDLCSNRWSIQTSKKPNYQTFPKPNFQTPRKTQTQQMETYKKPNPSKFKSTPIPPQQIKALETQAPRFSKIQTSKIETFALDGMTFSNWNPWWQSQRAPHGDHHLHFDCKGLLRTTCSRTSLLRCPRPREETSAQHSTSKCGMMDQSCIMSDMLWSNEGDILLRRGPPGKYVNTKNVL